LLSRRNFSSAIAMLPFALTATAPVRAKDTGRIFVDGEIA
jgi:hypothetical protein